MTRRRILLTFAALGLMGACKLDDLAGTSEIVGAPLLDLTLGGLGDATLPRGSYVLTTAATRDTMTLTLANLPVLPQGEQYQVFVVDSAATSGNMHPVGGRLIRGLTERRPVNRDSSVFTARVDTMQGATSITPRDTAETFVYRVVDPRIATSHYVVVAITSTLETSDTQLAPETRQGFLYARYRNPATGAFANTGTLTFGSFAINSAARLPFVNGLGSIQGSFRGSELRLNMRDLIRPPAGFQYAGWLIDTRTGMSVRLGGLLTPVPENASLDDADVGTGRYLTDAVILEAQLRADTASLGNIRWEDYTNLVLLLEPKGATPPSIPSGANILGGAIPTSVATRSPGAGKIFGTVTSTGGNAVTNSTVYLTGATSPSVLLVTNAGADGAFRFRTVSVGSYRIYVIPPNGTAATDSSQVTVGTRTLNGAVVGDSINVTLRIP